MSVEEDKGHQPCGQRQHRRVTTLLGWLLLASLCWLVACAGEETETAVPLAVEPTTSLMPTPTLVPALAAVEPTATPTAASFVGALVDEAIAQIIPTETAVPSATPSPIPSPTATPPPGTRLELAQQYFHNGNYEAVIEQLEAVLPQRSNLSDEQVTEMLYTLGRAYVRDGRFKPAINIFNDLLAGSAGAGPVAAYFYLGEAYQATDDEQSAIHAYEEYLARESIMAAYVQPRMAQMLDGEAAVAAYEAALDGQAHRLEIVAIRLQLAQFYMDAGDYQAAVRQYDAVHDMAETERTKGEMTYRAGSALLLAGDADGGYARYKLGINNYPRAYESYQGLVALVEAGIFVDEYQRGLVDYYAGVYEPAIGAFGRYIADNQAAYKPDTHLYLAWCYEELGDVPSAYTELAKFARVDGERALIEQAQMAARLGDRATAIDLYGTYVRTYPEGDDVPLATWWLAALTERNGDEARAISYYEDLANTYPDHEDAPEALFRAGWLAQGLGQDDTAVSLWLRLAETYPSNEFASASRVWLLRTLPDLAVSQNEVRQAAVDVISATLPLTSPVGITTTNMMTEALPITPTLDFTAVLSRVESLAATSTTADYYAVRARAMVADEQPFVPYYDFVIPQDETADQQTAEAWLRQWLELAPDADVRTLSPTLAADPRLIVGSQLWELGLWSEGKRELESLRADYVNDALASYQLALYFRDLGLYRSSIIAATSVLALSGQSIFEAPKFIGRLSYPIYYHDLVVPLAEKYGYDPRLQFALIRQESLFESFAESSAAAQGLSQVIPDTGDYIAGKLNWPDFETEDLHLPYIGLNFGAFYLDQQLDSFDGEAYVALSAYNAGPGNAARWYNEAGADLDSYHETVDFGETRLYIERNYIGFVIYDYLYNGA